ncbi:MAG: hypothetical protein C0407_16660 [Desulfobacca sp.]|nr:hypothetical protein [Desulfobacca sp.]
MVTTRAGTQDYDESCRLRAILARSTIRCSSIVAGLKAEQDGIYVAALGFIPGTDVLLQFQKGRIKVVDATSRIKEGMKVPTEWMKVAELPERIQQALEEWKACIEALGYEPSPWNLGFAQRVLRGDEPPQYLAVVMPRFRYRSGDREKPFGVVLVPGEHEDEMEVERVYNPQDIPNVPAEGTVLTLEELKGGEGPVQKLNRTWALMESNFLARYNRYGEPRPPRSPSYR